MCSGGYFAPSYAPPTKKTSQHLLTVKGLCRQSVSYRTDFIQMFISETPENEFMLSGETFDSFENRAEQK